MEILGVLHLLLVKRIVEAEDDGVSLHSHRPAGLAQQGIQVALGTHPFELANHLTPVALQVIQG